jgi:hypothetical protein
MLHVCGEDMLHALDVMRMMLLRCCVSCAKCCYDAVMFVFVKHVEQRMILIVVLNVECRCLHVVCRMSAAHCCAADLVVVLPRVILAENVFGLQLS